MHLFLLATSLLLLLLPRMMYLTENSHIEDCQKDFIALFEITLAEASGYESYNPDLCCSLALCNYLPETLPRDKNEKRSCTDMNWWKKCTTENPKMNLLSWIKLCHDGIVWTVLTLCPIINKTSPSGVGLKWSCLYTHKTTCKLIPIIHPTRGFGVPLFYPKGKGCPV